MELLEKVHTCTLGQILLATRGVNRGFSETVQQGGSKYLITIPRLLEILLILVVQWNNYISIIVLLTKMVN